MLRIILLLLAVFVVGWVAWPAYSAYQIYGGMSSADEGVLKNKINWDSLRTSLRPVVSGEVNRAIDDVGGGGAAGALMPQLKKQYAPQLVDAALKHIVTPKGLAQVMAHGGDVSKTVSQMVSDQVGKLGGLGALTGGGDGGSGSNGGIGGVLGGLLGGKKGGGDSAGGLGGLIGGLAGNDKVKDAAGGALGKMMGGGKGKQQDGGAQDAKAEEEGPSYGLGNLKRFAYTGIGSMEVGVAKDPEADNSDVVAVMEFQDFDWKLTGLVPRLR